MLVNRMILSDIGNAMPTATWNSLSLLNRLLKLLSPLHQVEFTRQINIMEL